MEFYDEVSQVESSVDSPEVEAPLPPVDHAVKLLHLSDLSVELGSNAEYPENGACVCVCVWSVPDLCINLCMQCVWGGG